MGTLLSRTLVLAAVCFIGGWALVLAFHEDGYSTGIGELLWRIGGVTVYASVLSVLVTALAAAVFLLRSGADRLRRRR